MKENNVILSACEIVIKLGSEHPDSSSDEPRYKKVFMYSPCQPLSLFWRGHR